MGTAEECPLPCSGNLEGGGHLVYASAEGHDEAEEDPLPSCGTLDFGGGFREVAIVKAIEEYLAYHHLQDSLEAFRQDVEQAGLKRVPSNASQGAAREVDGALANFDRGRREEFLASWIRLVPEEFRKGRDGRSLELRLHAHFAVFGARQALEIGVEPAPDELHRDLEPFRAYLNEHGLDEVCGDEALLPLFALPFVQRPHAQPHVSEVFTAGWLQDLRQHLETQFRSCQPPIPTLYSVMDRSPVSPTGGSSWQAVWAEVYRLADSGLDAASLIAQGVPVSPDPLVRGMKQLETLEQQVPGGVGVWLAASSAQEMAECGEASPSRRIFSRAASRAASRSASRAADAPPRLPRDVDFGRLGEFICVLPNERWTVVGGGSPAPKLSLVLRAVLHRLASPEVSMSQRRGFLVSIACFDVFGVRSRPKTLQDFCADPELSELTVAILAVLACEAVGRTYVVDNVAAVESVVKMVMMQSLDSSLHTQALAALQRLSLRRASQDRMIELGLVEWVVGVLGWQAEAIQGAPSEFSLEFASALLMNLALRTAGKQRCVELDTLTVVLNLMEHWNPQIRTHVNGTLYSLLSVSSFRARARNAGLEGVLHSLMSQARREGDDISCKQVEFLLEQLHLKDGVDDAGSESGEDDADDDENFLEEEEIAGLLLGDRCGQSAKEALRCFRASSAVAEAQARKFRDFLN